MNPRATARVVGWLVRDTFRQALASRVFWLMLGATAVCTLVCLSAGVEGVRQLRDPDEIGLFGSDGKLLTAHDPHPGSLTLAFGAMKFGLFRDGEAEVHFLRSLMAKWVAGAAGTLLALIWTAGFLPEFFQPSAASVLLAKPVPRGTLLAGKALGVFAFVAFHASLFFAATWLALGLRTGVWGADYLLGAPLLVLHFGIVFGASALLAVCTRSTVTCVFGSVVFWVICFAMNYGRLLVVALPLSAPGTEPLPRGVRAAVEAAYWVMPKPADLVILLDRSMSTEDHFQTLPGYHEVARRRAFHPWASPAASVLFTLAMLCAASRQLAETDY